MSFKLIFATVLAATLMQLVSGVASAQTMSQAQQLDQSVKVTCNVGAYGQNSSCTAEASQSGRQSQRMDAPVSTQVVYLQDGTTLIAHDPVNTGLDYQTLAAALGTIVSGSVAFALKNRVA
jgi:hypothetical protein